MLIYLSFPKLFPELPVMDFKIMRRIRLIFPLFLIVLYYSPAFAAEEPGLKGKIDLGAKLSHIAIGNSVVAGVDAAFDTTNTLILSLTYHPVEYLSLELGASRFETDIKLGFDENFAPYGTFSQSALSFTMKYEGEMQDKDDFRMFVGAGLARYFNDIERELTSEIQNNSALNRTIEIEDSIGYHGTIGFEYSFTKSLILSADVLLSATEANAQVRDHNSDIEETKVALNTFVFGAGLKYRF